MISSEDIIQFVATVEDNQNLETVSAALTTLGLTVEKKLDKLGLLTGHMKRGLLHKASQVPGVMCVEEQVEMRIPEGEM